MDSKSQLNVFPIRSSKATTAHNEQPSNGLIFGVSSIRSTSFSLGCASKALGSEDRSYHNGKHPMRDSGQCIRRTRDFSENDRPTLGILYPASFSDTDSIGSIEDDSVLEQTPPPPLQFASASTSASTLHVFPQHATRVLGNGPGVNNSTGLRGPMLQMEEVEMSRIESPEMDDYSEAASYSLKHTRRLSSGSYESGSEHDDYTSQQSTENECGDQHDDYTGQQSTDKQSTEHECGGEHDDYTGQQSTEEPDALDSSLVQKDPSQEPGLFSPVSRPRRLRAMTEARRSESPDASYKSDGVPEAGPSRRITRTRAIKSTLPSGYGGSESDVEVDDEKDSNYCAPSIRRRPVKNNGSPDGKFPCSQCGQILGRLPDLKRHVRSIHGDPSGQVWQCWLCSLVVSRKDALARHIRSRVCRKRK